MAGGDVLGSWPQRLLMVGCGNMGGAMLAGWLAAGMAPDRLVIVDPRLAEAPAGVRLLRDFSALTPDHDAILLGVKPQLLDQVAPHIAPLVNADTVVMSILAGVELASLAARFPAAGAILRIMPNLAAAIGKSPVALVAQGADAARCEAISTLMAPLGTPEWLAGEGLFDAVTALGGSGPAFIYRFIAALAQAATAQGIAAEQAGRMAVAMAEGAAALAAVSPHDPAELARRVASPGGVTQAGLDVLDHDDALVRLAAATLDAARDRSAEMAAIARG